LSPAAPLAGTGVIHGRFQVPHNDHLRYLLAGKELCRFLYVGVTNPDPLLTREDAADARRSLTEANPLTYWERMLMCRDMLLEAGVPRDEFEIVPFPVNLPELWPHYVPLDSLFFVSIYDDWGRAKERRFRERGLRVHVLWEVRTEDKGISGSDVRSRMAEGRPWRELVPPAVARLAEAWDLPGRFGAARAP